MMQTPARGPSRFLSKRLPARLFGLSAVVALGLLGKIFFLSPLPQGAFPVLSTARWIGRSPQFPDYPPFHWLPNGDIAFLENSTHGTAQVCYQKVNAGGPIGEVRRGPELPLGPVSGRFYPSPDEQWVAYVQSVGPYQDKTVLISADGRTTRSITAVGERFSAWLPDSRSFMSASIAPQFVLRVHHLDSPHVETLTVPAADNPSAMATLSNNGRFLIGTHFSRSPLGGISAGNYPDTTLRWFDGTHPDAVQPSWQATAPPETDLGSATPSPSGKELLWLAASLKPTPWRQWLQRVNPVWNHVGAITVRHFVSDIHGDHMRPVLADLLGRPCAPYGLWTPDGKHLSFIYKEHLYLVPLD